jgi:hypothetical protein
MSAGNYDILIEQGATFSIILNLKDESYNSLILTDMTFRGYLKTSFSDASPAMEFNFNVADQSIIETMGQVEVYLTATQTASLSAPASGIVRTITSMVYDIESVNDSSGVVVRWLQGVANISPEVTK